MDKDMIDKKHTAVVVAVCLAGFLILLWMVQTGCASAIDDPIREAMYSLRNCWLTPIMKVITYMGNWQIITIFCLILLTIKKTRCVYGVPLSIGAIFVSLLNKGIKSLVARPRPDVALHLVQQGGWSFPSGHSITSIFFFGMLIWLLRRNMQNRRQANILTVFLAIPMVLVGISRVYLGVHYPTDVIAGWLLGIAIIAVMAVIIKRVSRKKEN